MVSVRRETMCDIAHCPGFLPWHNMQSGGMQAKPGNRIELRRTLRKFRMDKTKKERAVQNLWRRENTQTPNSTMLWNGAGGTYN